jgi:hypothetical protein
MVDFKGFGEKLRTVAVNVSNRVLNLTGENGPDKQNLEIAAVATETTAAMGGGIAGTALGFIPVATLLPVIGATGSATLLAAATVAGAISGINAKKRAGELVHEHLPQTTEAVNIAASTFVGLARDNVSAHHAQVVMVPHIGEITGGFHADMSNLVRHHKGAEQIGDRNVSAAPAITSAQTTANLDFATIAEHVGEVAPQLQTPKIESAAPKIQHTK